MTSGKPIAVVGGGPAGALLGQRLASAGREVILFEEKPDWEKPCGGGITQKALAQWPFLRDTPIERNWISHCELIAPSGQTAAFPLGEPIAIFSRSVLNRFLLNRARDAGAEVHRERVISVERVGGAWRLNATGGTCEAGYLVIAAGARNAFRAQLATPLAPEDLMVTAGYYVPGRSGTMQVQFLPGLHGYVWIFPRCDHFSAGICGMMREQTTAELRRTLEKILADKGIEFAGAKFYSHILPSLRATTLNRAPVSGPGWALVGDAAGFVDPITGEGLYYAMQSAELLAAALAEGRPELYAELLRKDVLPELEMAAAVANRFYRGRWMGETVIERMVQFTVNSLSFRRLMCDLFAGTQGYRDLRRRLYLTLPAMLAQSLASSLRLPASGTGMNAESTYRNS